MHARIQQSSPGVRDGPRWRTWKIFAQNIPSHEAKQKGRKLVLGREESESQTPGALMLTSLQYPLWAATWSSAPCLLVTLLAITTTLVTVSASPICTVLQPLSRSVHPTAVSSTHIVLPMGLPPPPECASPELNTSFGNTRHCTANQHIQAE